MGKWTTGSQNVCIGYQAGEDLTTGGQNVFIGASASRTTANGSTCSYAISIGEGSNVRNGSGNIAIGWNASCESSSSNQITLGSTSITKFRIPGIDFVLKDNGGTPSSGQVLTADSNGEGYWATLSSSSGTTWDSSYKTLKSSEAGNSNNINESILLGDDAGQSMTSGYSVAIGHRAAASTSSETICAVGYGAGQNTSGGANVAIGTSALTGATGCTAGSSVVVGSSAGYALSSGSGNTMLGFITGMATTTGSNNVYVGNSAGSNGTTANTNVLVGANIYGPTTGSNLVVLGYNASASSNTTSNEVTLGNSSISTLRCNTQTISSLSDRRDKTDINTLDLGLSFINALNPVKFKWETRDGNGKDGTYEAGFIAQDFQQVQKDNDADYLGLVMDENPDRLEASYGKLVPMLVQAVKELSAKVETLEAKLA